VKLKYNQIISVKDIFWYYYTHKDKRENTKIADALLRLPPEERQEEALSFSPLSEKLRAQSGIVNKPKGCPCKRNLISS